MKRLTFCNDHNGSMMEKKIHAMWKYAKYICLLILTFDAYNVHNSNGKVNKVAWKGKPRDWLLTQHLHTALLIAVSMVAKLMTTVGVYIVH